MTQSSPTLAQRLSWPQSLPFYYGWINVVMASLAMTATLPGRTHGLGLVTEAIGYQSLADRSPGEPDRDAVRQAVVALFASAPTGDPQTSVGQALALMNGPVVATAAVPATSVQLKRIIEQHPNAPQSQIEALYLATLSRLPTGDELQLLSGFNDSEENSTPQNRLGDIFWILLNSAEFAWNH